MNLCFVQPSFCTMFNCCCTIPGLQTPSFDGQVDGVVSTFYGTLHLQFEI